MSARYKNQFTLTPCRESHAPMRYAAIMAQTPEAVAMMIMSAQRVTFVAFSMTSSMAPTRIAFAPDFRCQA